MWLAITTHRCSVWLKLFTTTTHTHIPTITAANDEAPTKRNQFPSSICSYHFHNPSLQRRSRSRSRSRSRAALDLCRYWSGHDRVLGKLIRTGITTASQPAGLYRFLTRQNRAQWIKTHFPGEARRHARDVHVEDLHFRGQIQRNSLIGKTSQTRRLDEQHPGHSTGRHVSIDFRKI